MKVPDGIDLKGLGVICAVRCPEIPIAVWVGFDCESILVPVTQKERQELKEDGLIIKDMINWRHRPTAYQTWRMAIVLGESASEDERLG